MKNIINKYNKLSNITKASIWFLLCSFIQKGISIIVTPIFTRMLTTSEYGLYSVFTSWQYIFNIFISLSLSAGVYQQGLVKFDKDIKKFSSSMQGLSLLLVSIWTIIYIIFKKYFNSITGLNTIYIISMIIIIWTDNIFLFWANEQKVQFKYKKLIILTIVVSILNPLLSILFIKNMKDKVFARIVPTVIIGIMFYFILFVAQVKRGKKIYDKKYWKYALVYNIPLIPHYLSQTILSSSDRIMIEKLINADTAGIYSLAYSISLIMTIFNTSLMQTISPWIYIKIKNKQIEDIKKVSYISIIIVCIVNLLLIAFAPEAVSIFAPNEYYAAIYVIPPVSMSVVFMYLYDLFAKFEFYFEKTTLISFSTIIGAILNIILNIIFLKKYGYIAAAYTTLFCYFLYALFHYFAMHIICKKELDGVMPFNIKYILLILISFIILGFSLMSLYDIMLLRYLFVLVILLIIVINWKKIIYNLKRIISEK